MKANIGIPEVTSRQSEKHKDLGTSDFVTGIMEKHEKMAWFVRSYLK